MKMTKNKKNEKARTFKRSTFYPFKDEDDMLIGNALVPSDMTVTAWIDYCMKNIMEQKLQPTTLYGYNGIIRRYINPNLGKLKMQNIKPFTIQKYYTK